MSSLTARRAAVRAIPVMRPINDQLHTLRQTLAHVAGQPDSEENRTTLRALCLSAAFVIDSNSRQNN